MNCDELLHQFENEISTSSNKPGVSGEKVSTTGKHRIKNKIKAVSDLKKVKEGLFATGMRPERILGATTRKNKLLFLIKWLACDLL